MSLLFTNAISDRVDNNSTDSLDNLVAGTSLQWIYRTTADTDRFIWCKGRTDLSRAKYLKINSSDSGQGAGSLQLGIYRATTPYIVEPTGALVAADVWSCVANVWDTAGVVGDQHFYTGSLTEILTEPGAYTTRTMGTGTVADDSVDLFVTGNQPDLNNLSFAGRIAIHMLWNRGLTLGELRQQQFMPHKTSGCVKFTHYGYNGISTQPDWSGNQNFGTVTGATVAQHVPLLLFRGQPENPVFGAGQAAEAEPTFTGRIRRGMSMVS